MNLSLKCTNFSSGGPQAQMVHTTQNTVGNTVAYMIVFEKYNYYKHY